MSRKVYSFCYLQHTYTRTNLESNIHTQWPTSVSMFVRPYHVDVSEDVCYFQVNIYVCCRPSQANTHTHQPTLGSNIHTVLIFVSENPMPSEVGETLQNGKSAASFLINATINSFILFLKKKMICERWYFLSSGSNSESNIHTQWLTSLSHRLT